MATEDKQGKSAQKGGSTGRTRKPGNASRTKTAGGEGAAQTTGKKTTSKAATADAGLMALLIRKKDNLIPSLTNPYFIKEAVPKGGGLFLFNSGLASVPMRRTGKRKS